MMIHSAPETVNRRMTQKAHKRIDRTQIALTALLVAVILEGLVVACLCRAVAVMAQWF